MKTKLIIVEGIPGSGKTTIAGKIYEYIKNKSINVKLYLEDDLNPTDLKWHALMSREDYNKILSKYSDISEEIKNNTVWNCEQAIVAFNKISYNDKAFYIEMEGYEIYNGKVALEDFCRILKTRWVEFADNSIGKEELTIFESALMQSQINDLLAVHNLDEQTIYNCLEKLVKSVEKLNPVIIYLSPENVEETVKHIAEERISKDAQPNWIDMAKRWIEWVPFGKANGLKGFNGVVEFCKARKRVELGFLDYTTARFAIININNDYDKVFDDIKNILDMNL